MSKKSMRGKQWLSCLLALSMVTAAPAGALRVEASEPSEVKEAKIDGENAAKEETEELTEAAKVEEETEEVLEETGAKSEAAESIETAAAETAKDVDKKAEEAIKVTRPAAEDKTENPDEEKEEQPDPEADLEKEKDWEKTLPKDLTRGEDKDYRKDIVAIAESQIGYRESLKNYVRYSDGVESSYSRYGAWFGDDYADPWDAEFACFVLYYAGVPEVPYAGDTAAWTGKLDKKNMYFSPESDPEAGDLIFLQEEDDTFHVGIVTKVKGKKQTVVAATVDQGRDEVKEFTVKRDDERIFAYGMVVPVEEEAAVEEETAAPETEAETVVPETAAAEKETEAEAEQTGPTKPAVPASEEEGTLPVDAGKEEILHYVEQQLQARIGAGKNGLKAGKDVSITVSGELPENVTVSAVPVAVESDGEETLGAYQIDIRDTEGQAVHSESGDGRSILVTIYDSELLAQMARFDEVRGWHQTDDDTVDMEYQITEDGGIRFEADVY